MDYPAAPIKEWQVKAVIGGSGLYVTNTKAMNAIVEYFALNDADDVRRELTGYYGEFLESWKELNKFELLLILGELGYAYNELDEKFLTNPNY